MKIAIVSDLHIGYDRFEEDSYRQAREALEKASGMADAILIPGDVFDKRAPRPEVIAQAVNIFRDVSRRDWKAKVVEFKGPGKRYTDVPIIAIPGTHERVAEGKENVLRLLALAGLLVDTSESTTILEMGGEKVAVFGLGGVSEERVREMITALAPKPVPGAFSIFMMHQSTYELLPFSKDFIMNEEMPKGFDLYVNGHIHSMVEAMVHGKKFLIPGSTVLTQLKEGETDSKGFILFDTESYSHRFIPIDSRPFVAVRIKLKEATPKMVMDEAEREIEKALSKHKEMPIIRIILDGKIAEGYTGANMPIRTILNKYSGRAILEIDSSGLKSEAMEQEIKELKEGAVGGLPIKELGMRTFMSKLKESKYDSDVDASKLFEILSGQSSKEKVLKEANELLEEKG